MVYELLDWLTAQFDADEQAAHAAAPSPWFPSAEQYEVVDGDGDPIFDGFAFSNRELRDTVCYIVRHQPARTLRAVAAKRRIFERHGPILNDLNPYPVCMCCPNLDDDTNTDGEQWPCLTVRLLTVEYDDQPGYRPEWGPQ